MNALSCWHITYCVFWQNNAINQFHGNEHKAIHVFAISIPNASILPKPSACFFGFGSKAGCEEHTASACLGGLVKAENLVTEACLAQQSNSCWLLKSSWNKMLLSFLWWKIGRTSRSLSVRMKEIYWGRWLLQIYVKDHHQLRSHAHRREIYEENRGGIPGGDKNTSGAAYLQVLLHPPLEALKPHRVQDRTGSKVQGGHISMLFQIIMFATDLAFNYLQN